MKNIEKFNKILEEENWKIVKIPSENTYHYQLYFGKGKQVYNRYEYAFADFKYKSVFKDRLERFINNIIKQKELNLHNFVGKKINMFESEHQLSSDKKINTDVKCIGLVLGVNNNCFDIYDFQRPLGSQFYSLNIDEFEKKFNKGIYKPNFNILTSYENLELRKYMYNKSKKITDLCCDWDYRNIDMCDTHLGTIKVQKDKIFLCCERFSPELDDYIFGPTFEVKSKKLIDEFNILDLEKKEDVIDFLSELEKQIDYTLMGKLLDEEENKSLKKLENEEEMEIEYE